jgi:hypothetical protein
MADGGLMASALAANASLQRSLRAAAQRIDDRLLRLKTRREAALTETIHAAEFGGVVDAAAPKRGREPTNAAWAYGKELAKQTEHLFKRKWTAPECVLLRQERPLSRNRDQPFRNRSR